MKKIHCFPFLNKSSPQEGRISYLKVSKEGLKKLISYKTKTKPRLMQAALYVLAWSQGGDRALGVTYTYGKPKGRLCYDKKLRIGLCRFMGIRNKQVRRYLNRLKDFSWIHTTSQFNLAGDLEYRLAPAQYLMATGYFEKYFIFPLSGKGIKGFDIFAALERALEKDSHPSERDSKQLKFTISDRTRRWRARRHFLRFRQKVTPIKENNPVPFLRKEQKTTESREKSYKGWFWIRLKRRDKLKVPWYKVKTLSEFQKVRSGIAPDTRAVWHEGKLYQWNKYTDCYDPVPKQSVRKMTHIYLKPLESHRKNLHEMTPRQEMTPVHSGENKHRQKVTPVISGVRP